MVGRDHSRTVWLVENSYTIVSSHSVRMSIFELREVVVEEHNCLVRLSMRYSSAERYGCDCLAWFRFCESCLSGVVRLSYWP